VASVVVPGFRPSVSGFHFSNFFPHGPVLTVPLLGFGGLPIGDAANGLCGGMAFSVRDLFTAGRPPPPDTVPPAYGSPLFRYLRRRLFHSFNLPHGPLRYFRWMNLPDADTRTMRGLAWRTVCDEWPAIRADLDRGVLPALGLVRVRSPNPLLLGHNHQVLAYGYDLDERTGALAIRIYDPNYADKDDLVLSLNLADPTRKTPMAYGHGEAFRGFFHTRYRPADCAVLFGRSPAVAP
jgi:hypothetical protein